jgi:hypothetical protein
MLKDRLVSVAVGCLVVVGLSAACSSDSDGGDGDPAKGGTAGKTGGSSGSSSIAGSASAGKGGLITAGSGGTNHEGGAAGSGEAGRGDGGGEMGGEAGAPSLVGGAGAGGAGLGGAGGEAAGAGGAGGSDAVSCSTVRAELLGPIDTVSIGTVEDISAPAATSITLRVDASAGGYMAAANNPYIYVKLAGKSRAEVTDLAADASLDWDIALKRDNLRSNSGDSGPGAAEIAILEGADFATVTSAAVSTAAFDADSFLNATTCEPITDAIGKPLTRFDGWYAYDGATMKLTPANRVYLVRDAHAATLYKLQIVGYYVDVSNGMGGTVSKSAVYTLRYAAL